MSFEIAQLGADAVHTMRALLAVFGEAFERSPSYSAAPPSDEYLEELLSSESFVALAATQDSQVVGGLTAYELRKPEQERSEIFVYDLGVLEEHRRQGIATALLEAVREFARSRGAWVVFLEADAGDDGAIALYSRMGKREDTVTFDIPVE